MSSRQVRAAVTLLVLCGLLAVGLYVGLEKLFEPVDSPSAEPPSRCRTLAKGERLRAKKVVVNVLNGGTRAGLASQTLESLTGRGFRAGEVGNAPNNRVKRAQVWIVEGEEAAGRLVALNFGPRTPVLTHEDVVEGGVDVVVADGFVALAEPQLAIRLRKPTELCRPSPSAAKS